MNDPVILFVLAALAFAFKWLTSRAENQKNKPDSKAPNEQTSVPRRPVQRTPPQSEEERVRRFLEALGMPEGTQPPPPVRRRVVTPAPPPAQRPKAKRSLVQPLPPLVTTPEEIARPPVMEPPPVPEPIMVVETKAPPEIVLPLRPAAPVVTQSLYASSLGGMLRSRESIRQAIVLREVLGPPRGLQALETI